MICVAFCYPFVTLLLPSFHIFHSNFRGLDLSFRGSRLNSRRHGLVSVLPDGISQVQSEIVAGATSRGPMGPGKIWGWVGGGRSTMFI